MPSYRAVWFTILHASRVVTRLIAVAVPLSGVTLDIETPLLRDTPSECIRTRSVSVYYNNFDIRTAKRTRYYNRKRGYYGVGV